MSKLDAYLLAVQARDNAMLMFGSIALMIAVLLVLYHRPREDRLQLPDWTDLIMIMGCLIRAAVWLVDDNLWYDEAFTAAVVTVPAEDAWIAILTDVHPPLWYGITRLFTSVLGSSELVLRMPAVMCSIGALVLYYFWVADPRRGRRQDTAVSMIAMLLMAIAPVGVRYAAEARCYAALQLAAVAALMGATTGRPMLFLAGAVAAPWLHHMGWLITIPAALIIAYRERNAEASWTAVILAFPAALIAGYQVLGAGLGSGMLESGYWISDRGLGAYLYHAVFYNFFSSCTAPKGVLEWGAGLMAMGLWLVAWYGALRSGRWDLAMLAFGPGLVVLVVSVVKPMLLGRTLIGATPALYYLVAVGLDRLQLRRWTWLGSVAAVSALLLVGVVNQLQGESRGEITGLFEATKICETVTHSEPSSVVLAGYYAPDQHNVLWDGFEPGLQTGAMTLETEQALGIERGPIDDCLLYADHPAVPRQNLTMLEPHRARRDLLYTLTDDEFSFIALYRPTLKVVEE